jgi:molybdate transport system substrate-binding protein
MRYAILVALALLAAAVESLSTSADAAEIKLISSVGVKTAMEMLLPRFEESSGHKITALYGSCAALKPRIDSGEAFDVFLCAAGQVDDAIKQGKASGTRVDIARSGCAFAIRAGAPRPDISTDEKLKAFLLSVKSISASERGFSSAYFTKIATALGIGDAMKAKTTTVQPGDGAPSVAKGETELGIALMSEIAPVKGVEAVPFKTDDPASFLQLAGAIGANASDGEAARALLAYLQSSPAKEAFKAIGMETP